MNKTLSSDAISILNQYLNLQINSISCSVPYFNNKTMRTRVALAVKVGKGSPTEIASEIKDILFKKRNPAELTSESLKTTLIENHLGIDCSGFLYHILDAESKAVGNGPLNKRLTLIRANNFIRKFIASLNPVKNIDVATFASDKNSHTIALPDVLPGDIITMLGHSGENERDHALIIHQIDYTDSIPKTIHYSHSVAYPEDGLYGTGVRQGYIQITNPKGSIIEGNWVENNKKDLENRIFNRARKSKTELRRLL